MIVIYCAEHTYDVAQSADRQSSDKMNSRS